MTLDDLGHDVAVPTEARRVVSLVPSITEGLAAARPAAVVGATDWCTHPPDLDVVRVRGTKNPDRAAVEAARPDLVVANQEENRELDVQRLRDAGVPVWVTRIETVDDAFASLGRLFTDALGWGEPTWLADARQLWSAPAPAPRGRVAVPIWRDPWMVVGPRTFTADLLRRLGWEVTTGPEGDAHERYPGTDTARVGPAAHLVRTVARRGPRGAGRAVSRPVLVRTGARAPARARRPCARGHGARPSASPAA